MKKNEEKNPAPIDYAASHATHAGPNTDAASLAPAGTQEPPAMASGPAEPPAPAHLDASATEPPATSDGDAPPPAAEPSPEGELAAAEKAVEDARAMQARVQSDLEAAIEARTAAERDHATARTEASWDGVEKASARVRRLEVDARLTGDDLEHAKAARDAAEVAALRAQAAALPWHTEPLTDADLTDYSRDVHKLIDAHQAKVRQAISRVSVNEESNAALHTINTRLTLLREPHVEAPAIRSGVVEQLRHTFLATVDLRDGREDLGLPSRERHFEPSESHAHIALAAEPAKHRVAREAAAERRREFYRAKTAREMEEARAAAVAAAERKEAERVANLGVLLVTTSKPFTLLRYRNDFFPRELYVHPSRELRIPYDGSAMMRELHEALRRAKDVHVSLEMGEAAFASGRQSDYDDMLDSSKVVKAPDGYDRSKAARGEARAERERAKAFESEQARQEEARERERNRQIAANVAAQRGQA